MTDTIVNERSTYSTTISWEDGDGNKVALDTLKWSLVKHDGTIVNNRENEEITDPDNEEKITISGDDTAILDGYGIEQRWLIFEATYTDNNGVTQTLTGSKDFAIRNLKKVT